MRRKGENNLNFHEINGFLQNLIFSENVKVLFVSTQTIGNTGSNKAVSEPTNRQIESVNR